MPRRRALDRVGLACGIPVGLLGIFAILGWVFQFPSLVELLPSAAPMKVNTAVGLVLGALGLPGFARRSRVTLIAGGVLLVLGFLTLLEYTASVDLGIDQFLLADPSGGETPGRMGVNTAVCLTALGAAYTVGSLAPWMVGIVALPAAVGLLSVSTAAIVGYLTGLEVVYRWGGATRMGVHTALAILLLGVGLLVAGWRQVERRRATWLAIGLAGCVAGITLVVWMGGRADQARGRAQDAGHTANDIARLVMHAVDELADALGRLDERWAEPCADPCRRDLEGYARDFPELRQIGWVEEAANRVVVFRRTDAAVLEAADADEAVALAHTLADRLGRPSTGSRDAILLGRGDELFLRLGRSDGDGVLVASIDLGRFLERLGVVTGQAARVAVAVEERRVLPTAGGAPLTPSTDAVEAHRVILGARWMVQVNPPPRTGSYRSDLLLLGGLLIAFFVGATVLLWQTSQERAQALVLATRESATARARLQNVLDAATQIAIIATDPRGLITVFNAGAERMLHYRAAEMVGRRNPEVLHDPEECAARSRQLSAARGHLVTGFDVFVDQARERPFDEHEWTYVRKDGSRLDVNLVITAVRGANGTITGYLGIATDITTRKGLETALRLNNEELAEQTRRAEDANRAKSEFLAAMSHEIRTPMNAILGMADLLWDSPLAAAQRQYVDIFRRAGQNLLTLINDILDLSKIESGRIDLERVAFDLDEVIGQTTELVADRARAKGIALSVHRGAEVPVAVVGDPQRLRQVLINLLGNAVKFTERGAIRLVISGGASSGAVTFAVSDTGIGIPTDQLDRIFDDFTQADSSTTRRFGGTGLGLGISRRLVRLMGGELTAASTVGEGSTFTFAVVLEAASVPGPSPAPADLPGPRDGVADDVPTETRPLSILVAEDVVDNRLLVQAYLKGSPHTITFADDGGQAVGLFERRRFDVVLMDVQMPVMDGLEATRRIRAHERATGAARTPVVAVTANAGAADIEESRAAGCDAHLAKPLAKAALLAALTSATARRSEPALDRLAREPEFDDLVRNYLAIRRLELEELRQTLAAENFVRLRHIGHNLAGTGASYGFPDLSRLGRLLEASARAEDRDGLARHVQAIEECLAGAASPVSARPAP